RAHPQSIRFGPQYIRLEFGLGRRRFGKSLRRGDWDGNGWIDHFAFDNLWDCWSEANGRIDQSIRNHTHFGDAGYGRADDAYRARLRNYAWSAHWSGSSR